MLRAFHSPRYQTMCRRLKEARRRSGLTQAEAARALASLRTLSPSARPASDESIPLSSLISFALYGTSFDALVTSPSLAPARGSRVRKLAEPAVKPKNRKPGSTRS